MPSSTGPERWNLGSTTTDSELRIEVTDDPPNPADLRPLHSFSAQ